MHAHNGVHTHLGHDGEQAGNRRRYRTVGARQPEAQGQQRRLQTEDHEQHQARHPDEPDGIGVGRRNLHCQIGHVQRPQRPVDDAQRNQEHRRADQVEHHEMHGRPCARRTASMGDETVGCDEQNFEKDE